MKREEAIHIVKTTKDWSELREALAVLVPELEENEDERIRKKLIGIFTNQSLCDVYNLKSEDVLAYLEKQKEIDVLDEKEREFADNVDSVRQLVDDAYQKGLEEGRREQKSTSFNEPYNPDDYEVVMEGNATSLKRKEQKPVEVEQNPLVRMLKDKKAITEDVRNGIPTKTIEKERNVKFATPVDVSHVEWSEEDEKMLADTVFKLAGFMGNEKNLDWLKSLRPSWKPTTEQIGMVTRVCNGLHLQNSFEAEGMDVLLKQLEKIYWNTPDTEQEEHWKPND